jgi:hypothetical protein
LLDKFSQTQPLKELTIMKLVLRASIFSLALAGAFAGVASSHSATAQTVTLNRQAVSAALPAPMCEPETCKIHGGGK